MKKLLILCLFLTANAQASSLKEFIIKKGLHLPKKVSPIEKYHESKLPRLIKEEGPIKVQKNLFTKSLDCTYSCSPECIEKSQNHLAFCDSGDQNDPSHCVEEAKDFLRRRTQTSSSQDITDATKYCARFKPIKCLEETYKYLKQRRSTTKDDDITESYNFCFANGSYRCLDITYPSYSARTNTTRDEDVNDSLRDCR